MMAYSPKSFNWELLFSSYPQIEQYFKQQTNNQKQFLEIAAQLIIQSIKSRSTAQRDLQGQKQSLKEKKVSKQIKEQSNKKHYHVAYIKHNRFLSPSQKAQITPKVTQMIPIQSQKIMIYGKPKVKLDEGWGCPFHQQNCCNQGCCQNEEQCNQNLSSNRSEKENQLPSENENTHNSKNSPDFNCQTRKEVMGQYRDQIPYQYDEFLSPKHNLSKKQAKGKRAANKINQTVAIYSSPNDRYEIYNSPKSKICALNSPNTQQKQTVSNRLTSPKSFNKQPIGSQNYSNVQSKIKELVQRDKKNRQMERQLQKQKNQIEQLYERQNNLLMVQKSQKEEMKKKSTNEQKIVKSEMYKKVTDKMKYNEIENFLLSQSEDSIVNLHGHQNEYSRIKCYDCEIERLRKRKQKAKMAINEITKQQKRRSKLLGQIITASQIKRYEQQNSESMSEQSYDQIGLNQHQYDSVMQERQYT